MHLRILTMLLPGKGQDPDHERMSSQMLPLLLLSAVFPCRTLNRRGLKEPVVVAW